MTRLSKKHYGGSWYSISPQVQAITNINAAKEAELKKQFGQNFSIHQHSDIMRPKKSKVKFGGHIYLTNI